MVLPFDCPTIPKRAFLGCRKNVGPRMIEPFLVAWENPHWPYPMGKSYPEVEPKKGQHVSSIVVPSLKLLLGFLRKSQRLSILVVGIPWDGG